MKRKKEGRQQLRNRWRNGTRILSLPLFKEEAQQLEKAERLGRKLSPFPYLMLMGIRGDTSRLTRHALLNKMVPGQIGCGLGMAHHYRTPGARNKAHPHAGDSPLP